MLDHGSPARGCLFGCLLGLAAWAAFALVATVVLLIAFGAGG